MRADGARRSGRTGLARLTTEQDAGPAEAAVVLAGLARHAGAEVRVVDRRPHPPAAARDRAAVGYVVEIRLVLRLVSAAVPDGARRRLARRV